MNSIPVHYLFWIRAINRKSIAKMAILCGKRILHKHELFVFLFFFTGETESSLPVIKRPKIEKMRRNNFKRLQLYDKQNFQNVLLLDLHEKWKATYIIVDSEMKKKLFTFNAVTFFISFMKERQSPNRFPLTGCYLQRMKFGITTLYENRQINQMNSHSSPHPDQCSSFAN